ncbi:MAG TPA: VTT domain-containing protein [Candidatus Dormibacteraeota bacterium]|nr:VTT domain-containing protein [Candidatus Dormibacteraeota bacterium]
MLLCPRAPDVSALSGRVLPGLAGPAHLAAPAAICGLLFIEEVGVPLPMFPADALLVTAGLLIASGADRPWALVPLVMLSDFAGAVVGYLWARAVGSHEIVRLARRFGAETALERVVDRLRRYGAAGVLVGRLVPGTRVYTNLVAGAAGVRPRVFVSVLAPSVVIWAGSVMALGALVGAPVQRALDAVETQLFDVVVVLVVLGALYLMLRRMPPARSARLASAGRWPVRLPLATGVDLLLVAVLTVAIAARWEPWHHLPATVGLTLVAGATSLAYVALARRTAGGTAGEILFRVSYARPRIHRS